MNAEHPTVAQAADTTPPPQAAVGSIRRRRPEPARTAPHRGAAKLLRETATAAEAATAAPSAPAAAPTLPADGTESAVARGVRLGYQVIEEQIHQGQKLAQRLGRAAGKAASSVAGAATGAAAAHGTAGDAGAGAGELQELFDRVVHLYKDMGALCVDAVDTLVHHPVLRSGLARMTPGAAPGGAPAPTAASHAAAGQAGGTGFALDIRCSRRTQVTLDLPPRPDGFRPLVHALHAGDPALAPLTGVRFGTDEDSSAAVLQLDIADTLPAATYTGVVVDAATNQPRGTLSVRLLP